MTSQQRCSSENGLWLCQNCAKLVDNDPIRYSPGVLRDWKGKAEQAARLRVESPRQERSQAIAPDSGADIPSDTQFVPVEPRLTEGDAVLPLFRPNTKCCSGRFIIANDMPRPLNVTWIDLGRELPEVNLVSTHHRPTCGIRSQYDQKLPLYIRGYERTQVFFITEDIVRPVRGDLPDIVRLEVVMDDCTTLSILLHRKGNTDQYSSEHDLR